MSRSAEITLMWADEDRPFRLKLKQLDLLQERCGERGPMRMLRDLVGGEWKARDVSETIRLGLVGAGLDMAKADKLVREYVEDRPLVENVLVAQAILQAAVVGPPIDAGAKPPAPPGEQATAEKGSTSLSSTETGPSSGGHPPTSVN